MSDSQPNANYVEYTYVNYVMHAPTQTHVLCWYMNNIVAAELRDAVCMQTATAVAVHKCACAVTFVSVVVVPPKSTRRRPLATNIWTALKQPRIVNHRKTTTHVVKQHKCDHKLNGAGTALVAVCAFACCICFFFLGKPFTAIQHTQKREVGTGKTRNTKKVHWQYTNVYVLLLLLCMCCVSVYKSYTAINVCTSFCYARSAQFSRLVVTGPFDALASS